MCFTNDAMWQAVVTCDKSARGSLFYAVKTVGVSAGHLAMRAKRQAGTTRRVFRAESWGEQS